MSGRQKCSNLLNSLFQGYLKLKEIFQLYYYTTKKSFQQFLQIFNENNAIYTLGLTLHYTFMISILIT